MTEVTGGCQCGAVRYVLRAEPRGSLCHCRMCQRASGGAFAALTCVPKQAFEWTRGQPAIFASSTIVERGFCRHCGTPLSFTYEGSANTNVTVGSLDEPERANILMHFGVESRLSWLKICDGLPEVETGGDPAAAKRLEGMVSRQSEVATAGDLP